MIFVKISQNFIKSHLKFALSHRFETTAYGMHDYNNLLMKKFVKQSL